MPAEAEERVIAVTRMSEIRPLLSGGVEVSILYEQLRQSLPHSDAHRLLARPLRSKDKAGHEAYQWLTEVPGEAVPFPELDDAEQEQLLMQARREIRQLEEGIASSTTLHPQDQKDLLGALDAAFEIPSMAALYRVGSRPVLTQWGHLLPRWDAPRRVLRGTIEARVGDDSDCGINVALVEPDGELAPGMPVRAWYEDGSLVGTETTDAAGRAFFGASEPGLRLTVGLAAEVESAAAPTAQGVARLGGGETVTLTLTRSRTIFVTAFDRSGDTPSDEVQLIPEKEGTNAEPTGQPGQVQIHDAPLRAERFPVRVQLPDGRVDRVKLELTPETTNYHVTVKRRINWSDPRLLLGAAAAALALAGVALWAFWFHEGSQPLPPATVADEVPADTTVYRAKALVSPDGLGLQLFSADGRHLAGTPLADGGFDSMPEEKKRELVATVYEPNPQLNQNQYDPSTINAGSGYDTSSLHWEEMDGYEVGYSGPTPDKGIEVITIRGDIPEGLLIFTSPQTPALMSAR